MTTAPGSPPRWAVPELGPSLGRLVDPAASSGGALGVTLDDIRLDLVTGLFDLAGAARSFAAAGDPDGAMASLGRVAWLELWEKAVAAAAARITGEANAELRGAAAESRYPARRAQSLLLSGEDARAIGARLGSEGARLVAALDQLEQAVHTAGGAPGRGAAGALAWETALGGVARRLESAWLALETGADAEQRRWAAEIAAVRGWRRPTWPVWILTGAVIAAAVYLGLVLGGYIPVPQPLEGFAAYWWTKL